MKTSELFEERIRIDRSKLFAFIYDLAIKSIKTDKHSKDLLAYYARETDDFWIHDFDILDNVLEDFINGEFTDFNDIYNRVVDEAANSTVQVGERMVDWLLDPMNHAPGYKVPIADIDNDIRNVDLEKVFSVVPGSAEKIKHLKMVEKEKEKAEKEKERIDLAKTVDGGKIQELATYISNVWPHAFAIDLQKELNKHPQLYDMPKMKYDGEESIIKGIEKQEKQLISSRGLAYEILNWVLETELTAKHKLKMPTDAYKIIKERKYLKMLIPLIPNIQKYLK